MFILIKGTREEAEAALVARGLLTDAIYLGGIHENEQQFSVPKSAQSNVADWYALDPGNPPYPSGTLLFYTFPEQPQ